MIVDADGDGGRLRCRCDGGSGGVVVELRGRRSAIVAADAVEERDAFVTH